jgi:hypothetical protein
MRGLSQTAIDEVEKLACGLLAEAIGKHGCNIPACDPDYCEAFGVLRGAIATQGRRLGQKIRVAPGHGDWTYSSVHVWLDVLKKRVLRA